MLQKPERHTVALVVIMGIALGIGSTATRAEEATGNPAVAERNELKIYGTAVTVRTKIQCRKYEGKVLNCTFDPRSAVKRVLDVKLFLGFADVEIDGKTFSVEQTKDGMIRFFPSRQGSREDYTGERELTVGVVYVD